MLSSEQVRARISALAAKRVDDLCSTIPPPQKSDGDSAAITAERLEAFKKKKQKEIENQLRDVANDMAQVSVARLDS